MRVDTSSGYLELREKEFSTGTSTGIGKSKNNEQVVRDQGKKLREIKTLWAPPNHGGGRWWGLSIYPCEFYFQNYNRFP